MDGSSFPILKEYIKNSIRFISNYFFVFYLIQNIDLSIIGFGQYNGIFKYLWIYFPVRIFIWAFFPYNILIDVRNKHQFYMKVVIVFTYRGHYLCINELY